MYAAHVVTEADQLGDPEIIICADDETGDLGAADPITEIPLPDGADPLELLAAHGWRVTGEPTTEPYTIVDVTPADWPALIRQATAARAAAQAELDRRDVAWRRVIADAMRAEGQPRRPVAEAAGITEARAYQLRDGRR